MSEHTTDALDPCRLNELRQAKAMADMADEHLAVGRGGVTFTKGTGWICKAVGVDLDDPLDEAQIETIRDWLGARGAPAVIETTTHADPASLDALRRCGLYLAELENVLARPVAPMEVVLPEGYRIERLDRDDAAAMRRHAEIVCGGFAEPGKPVTESLLRSAIRSQEHPNSIGLFVVAPDGEYVAASGMEVTPLRPSEDAPAVPLTSLWGTSVVPAHRRRGLQQALIAERLSIAAARGAVLAVVESRPGIPTERNAARLGFSLRYVRLVFRA